VLGPVPIRVAADDLDERLTACPRESGRIEEVGLAGGLDRAQEVRPRSRLAGPDVCRGAVPALAENLLVAGVEVEGLVRRVGFAAAAEGGEVVGGVAFPPLDVRHDVARGACCKDAPGMERPRRARRRALLARVAEGRSAASRTLPLSRRCALPQTAA